MTSHVNPRVIELDIDGVDRSDEISKVVIRSGPPTSDRHLGGDPFSYTIAMTVAQDHASGTLWSLMWFGSGSRVDGVYAPYGNGVPSETQPHYAFTAIVDEPAGDLLGGEATTSMQAVAVIEVEWELTRRPTRVAS